MRAWRLSISLVAGAALLAAAAVGFAGDPAGGPAKLRFVMPRTGAYIASGPVFVAGSVPPGGGFVNLLLDGTPVPDLTREEGSFSAVLAPAPGPHTLEARAGSATAAVTFSYGTGGRGLAPYRYHVPVLERRCAECHAGLRRATPTAEADTCKACHRKLAVFYPYVHGPVAVGKCVVCHEPHGSSQPALTRADARTMCTGCHDQPGAVAHVEQARSRVCYLCHNPHASMNKKFLYDIVK